MRRERAAALADEVRHRHLVLAARLGHRVHDVVRVLLQRVVHARVRLRRPRAVVVDAEPAADVDVRDVDAELAHLDVEARDLLEPALDEADVRDLAAEVEVQQLDDVESSALAEPVDELHELHRVEPELRFLPGALRPPSGALGRELDADAARRRHPELVGDLEQHVDLAELLDDDEHTVADLLPHEGEPHELVVLVAVADDDVLRALGHREHRLQLRLRAALQTDAVRLAELDDLLDDVPLLIDLDRVDGRVPTAVLELLDRRLEARAQLLDAGAEDVGEAEQHGKPDSLLFQVAREVQEVELALAVRAIGAHHDAARVVDVEVPGAPPFDVVECACAVDRPGLALGCALHLRLSRHARRN